MGFYLRGRSDTQHQGPSGFGYSYPLRAVEGAAHRKDRAIEPIIPALSTYFF
jgi:hypothetical protein